ncbi:DUF4034 domain-containing protein [Actinoplanes auranticolor]|uniref:DUF4034 domain-containing protein n=1 Tax=Actinoplanes auranticolor TaxID=47988 RepID=A0A919VIK9_9ACTN|nr:DUF4034 domain-containing protein [Actinoplanes auranticolor]GIM63007.1 hypothetical protein Aau02nite_01260 [Actinoplanes auranticolor]
MWPFRKRGPAAAGLTIDPANGDPQVRALMTAVATRERSTIRAILDGAPDPDTQAYLMEYAAGVDGVQDWIGEWIAAEPHATLPLLLKGCHGVFWAWEARGGARAEHTREEQFREFHRRLRIAENPLDEVADRDPDNVTAWTWLVTSARGRQVAPDEAAARFAEVVKRHPAHVVAHEQHLQYLCAKWFGSDEQMFAFAREAAAAAPVGSLVPEILVVAHIEKWLSLPRGEDDAYLRSAPVRADMLAAVQKSLFHPAFTAGVGWFPRANSFAMGLEKAGELEAAARVFDMIGDRVTEWPWSYSGDVVTEFAAARERVYQHRG